MRTLFVVAVIAVAIFDACIAFPFRSCPALAATGDPVAKAEVIAAFERLNSVPSYRMKTSAPEGTTVLVEVVRPDKRHYVAQSPTRGAVEYIIVGTQTRERVNMPGRPAGWRCSTKSRPLDTRFDLDRVRKDLTEVVRKPDTVIDGIPVHTYAPAAGGATALYVGFQTNLPRRLVLVDGQSGKTATIDFYDYGVPITIILPPCG